MNGSVTMSVIKWFHKGALPQTKVLSKGIKEEKNLLSSTVRYLRELQKNPAALAKREIKLDVKK